MCDVVRLYDEHSGEMVWISDEHEGDRVNLWRFGGPAPSAGLWTDDALWIIRVSISIGTSFNCVVTPTYFCLPRPSFK